MRKRIRMGKHLAVVPSENALPGVEVIAPPDPYSEQEVLCIGADHDEKIGPCVRIAIGPKVVTASPDQAIHIGAHVIACVRETLDGQAEDPALALLERQPKLERAAKALLALLENAGAAEWLEAQKAGKELRS